MLKRLRIVSVCRTLPNPDDPSAGVFVLNRLRAMAEHAHVTVIQPLPYTPAVKPLVSWARPSPCLLDGLEIVRAPMFYIPGVLKSIDATWLARAIRPALSRIHAEAPVDAVDAHFGYPEGAGCLKICRQLGIPLFVTVRGFEAEYLRRRWVGDEMLNAMQMAKGCISVSHSLRDLMVRSGVDPNNIRVVHNAIDTSTFRVGEQARARALIDVQANRPLIVSVGHLVSRKRHHVLIEAFSRVKAQAANALLAIVGAPSFERAYPKELSALAARKGVSDSVLFLGNIPPANVAVWLEAADVFALATAREGCCNAVLEALGTGLPVVTTPAGDNAHFVRDGVNGYLVPVDDSSELANGILRAMNCRWDRQAIAERLANEAGSWANVGARVLDFMNERLESRSSSSMTRRREGR